MSEVKSSRVVSNKDWIYYILSEDTGIYVYRFVSEDLECNLVWELVLSFPVSCDDAELSYTLLEVVDIVQWHLDKGISF